MVLSVFVDNTITLVGPAGQIEELRDGWVGFRFIGAHRYPGTDTIEAQYTTQTEWKPVIDLVLENAQQFLATDFQLEWASTKIPEWNGLAQIRECEVYVAVDGELDDIRHLGNLFEIKQKGFWKCLEDLREEHGRSTSS